MRSDEALERLAILLMLAYLQPDPDMHPAYVMRVFDEAGLPPDEFDVANVTACAAANFWWETNPAAGRRMLTKRLEELEGAVTA